MVLLPVYPSNRLTAQTDTLPVGYGTLKRDEIVVRFTTGSLEIQFLPVHDQVIRLLARDTYQSLKQLIKSRQGEIDAAAQRAGVERPVLVMVTFFGLLPQARFVPEDVNVVSRGRLFRPIGIVPLSPTWSSYQLEARQQAVAFYLFEDGISFRESLTVTYEGLNNEAWGRAVQVLERERARVTARARAQSAP